MKYALGNMLNGAGGLNADQLALDLQFAADKTLTARKGPTPTFTRTSGDNRGTTYFGPSSINVVYSYFGGFNVNVSQIPAAANSNGRLIWQNGDTQFYYTGSAWALSHDGNLIATSAPTSSFRPDGADWNGTAAVVTATGQFGIVWAANNEPRFDHATTAPNACRGLLIEESRTNLVFPSDTLTTQTRTVTAVAHTLSFYGTGTVVLSGVAIATVTGTGAFPTRTTLTFTPTAGSLTLTVTGSVTQAQLEAGSFATSYIPTTTSALARSADVCSITGANFTGTNFYNPSAGTIIAIGSLNTTNTNSAPEVFKFNDGTNNNRVQVGMTNVPTEAIRPFIVASGSLTYNSTTGTATIGVERKIGTAYSTNDAISVFNGTLGTQDTTVTMPTGINQAILFAALGRGTISSIRYFKKRLPNAKLQSLTA